MKHYARSLTVAGGAGVGRGNRVGAGARVRRRALELASHTAGKLDETGADVVVIGRIGQDLTRYRRTYSHLKFAYRDGDARWRVVHKLNRCGTADATVFRQGLGEFFLDDLHRHQAGIAVLERSVQARLLPLLKDNSRLAQLHTPTYDMLAYPWAQKYQQSHQWAIETLAAGVEPGTDTRERAQAWLRLRGYQPTTLSLGPLTRLGARVGSANIAFDDHPNEKRFADRIETVTADSVFVWLGRSGLAGALQEIR